MPIDSAAIRLSRIAIIARPVLECIRFKTMNKVKSSKSIPMVNVAALGVPVIPCAPLMSTTPVSSIPKEVVSLIEK